ncbi:MAG: universal stress protein [Actinomycetes bacterium]
MTANVVVGFIENAEGAAALEAAIAETQRRNAHLILVNSAKGGREDEQHVVSTRLAVERASAELAELGLDFEVVEFARGNDPATDLLDVANANGAELIVIGLRRRSAVGKLLLGSNSQTILLGADCPVLAVKSK